MKKSRSAWIAICSGALLAVAGGGTASAVDLRYASSQPVVNAVFANAVVPFVARVKKDTNGEVVIQTYPGGQLASAKGALDALRDGTADASMIVSLWMPSELRYINALAQVLFSGGDPVAITGATAETILLHCEGCKAEMAKNDAMSLAPYASSPYYTMCNAPVATAGDWKGKRVRIAGGAQSALLDKLGAARVIVTAPEIAESLSRGQIDCAIAPLTFLKSYSVGDSAKYIIDYPMGSFRGVDVFAFRKSSWDKLTQEQRKTILKQVPLLVAESAINGNIGEMEEARSFAKQQNIQFGPADESLKKVVAEVTEAERDLVAKEAKARGVKDFDEVLAAHQKALEKWTKIIQEIGNDPNKFAEALWREVYSKL